MKTKPKITFCWHCGRKLWGSGTNNKYKELIIEGHKRILHKACAQEIIDYKYYENIEELKNGNS